MDSPHPVRQSPNDRLKRSYPSGFWAGLAVAAALHFGILAFWPSFVVTVQATEREAPIVIDVYDPSIPEPPAEIERPPIPIPGDIDLVDMPDIPDDWVTFRPDPVGPPPVPGDRDEIFAVYEVAPRILNAGEVQRILSQHYPRAASHAGITGTTLLLLLLDEDGELVEATVYESSGHAILDEAALRAVHRFRFAPALNRDQPVAVRVTVPISFEIP